MMPHSQRRPSLQPPTPLLQTWLISGGTSVPVCGPVFWCLGAAAWATKFAGEPPSGDGASPCLVGRILNYLCIIHSQLMAYLTLTHLQHAGLKAFLLPA